MITVNQRVRIKTFSGSWIEATTLIQNPKNENWICVFDDGSIAQWPESRIQPVPVEVDAPLTPEVF